MPHHFDLRVYYEDTDLAGIVYYANYLKFMERGRSEAVREAGIDQLALRDKAGAVFAVRRIEVDYLAPARFDDVLTVVTRATKLGAASLDMRQEIWRGDTQLIGAEVKIVFMTMAGKPVRFPKVVKGQLLEMVEA